MQQIRKEKSELGYFWKRNRSSGVKTNFLILASFEVSRGSIEAEIGTWPEYSYKLLFSSEYSYKPPLLFVRNIDVGPDQTRHTCPIFFFVWNLFISIWPKLIPTSQLIWSIILSSNETFPVLGNNCPSISFLSYLFIISNCVNLCKNSSLSLRWIILMVSAIF